MSVIYLNHMQYFVGLILSFSMIASVVGQSTESFTQVKLYTNLYSQTSNFDQTAVQVDDTVRRSFVTNILELNFIRPEKRSWWGIDAYVRASRQGPKSENPLKVLAYENNGLNAQTSLSHIGPKFNWRPVEEHENLWLRFILLAPLGGSNLSASNIPALDNSGFQFWSQINYNAKLAEALYGYGELSIVARLGRDAIPKSDLFIPIKAFLTYFLNQKLGLFGFVDFTPTISSPTAFYFQGGGGVKLFPNNQWEIELSSSRFVAGKSSGAGLNFNIGLSHKFLEQE
jgi:hypothetical protein